MPRRLLVFDLKDILIRLRNNQSIKSIKRELGRHKTVIRKIKKIAEENKWLDPENPLPEDYELKDAYEYYDNPERQTKTHPLDRFRDGFERWIEAENSYTVMHHLISKTYKCSESTVRRYVQKHYPRKVKLITPRDTIAGEVMEVDFGYIGLTWDEDTKRRRKTWFFSGRLRHSRSAYREIVFDQKQETFFFCHIHAFEYFGGVPEKVVPDNLKAAVIRASFYEPLVNRAYRELAKHYGFLISPTLPRTPEHKGGVESDVKYVKRNFLPIFKENQWQKGRDMLNAADLREELEKWNKEVAEQRIIGKVGKKPCQIFEQEEKDALKPLPKERWDLVTCKEAVVGPDWRIQFDKAFYSVPHKYARIRAKVLVIANSRIVRICYDLKEITTHVKAKQNWEKVIKQDHAPPNSLEYLKTSTKGLLYVASKNGENVYKLVKTILENKTVDGIRPVRAILGFANKYSSQRLEAACRRALYYESPSYVSVKRILKRELDKLPLVEPVLSTGQHQFRFQREKGYFDPKYQPNIN
jgi:hypothetical protein